MKKITFLNILISFIIITLSCENSTEEIIDTTSVIKYIDTPKFDYYTPELNSDSSQFMVQDYRYHFIKNDTNLIASCIVRLKFKLVNEIYRIDSVKLKNKEYLGVYKLSFDSFYVENYKSDSVLIEEVRFTIAASYSYDQIEVEKMNNDKSNTIITRTSRPNHRLTNSHFIKYITPLREIRQNDISLNQHHLYQQYIKHEQSQISNKYTGILTGLGDFGELIKIREKRKIVSVPLSKK